MTSTPCVISAADHAGWAHFVCVAAPRGMPAVIERRRVTTINAGLPTMPYHHESLGIPVEAANALIARVRRSVAECTSRALRDVVADLSPSNHIVALAIRKPPFPELPDTVATVRQSYQRSLCVPPRMTLASRSICAAAAKKTHARLHGSRWTPMTSNRSSASRVAHQVRPGLKSTDGRMPQALRCWRRARATASRFNGKFPRKGIRSPARNVQDVRIC